MEKHFLATATHVDALSSDTFPKRNNMYASNRCAFQRLQYILFSGHWKMDLFTGRKLMDIYSTFELYDYGRCSIRIPAGRLPARKMATSTLAKFLSQGFCNWLTWKLTIRLCFKLPESSLSKGIGQSLAGFFKPSRNAWLGSF